VKTAPDPTERREAVIRRIDKTRVTTLLTALVDLYDASAEFRAQLPATPRTPQGRRWVVAIEALDHLGPPAPASCRSL
jgi:hypothetical protein